MYYGTDAKRRAEEPDAFLLSLEDSAYIVDAHWTEVRVLTQYINLDEDERQSPEVQKMIYDSVISALEADGFDIYKIGEICRRLIQSNYWTFSITKLEITSPGNYRETFEVIQKSPQGTDTRTVTSQTNPEFFKLKTIPEKARELGIPDDCKYVVFSELQAARTLSYYYAVYIHGAESEDLMVFPQAEPATEIVRVKKLKDTILALDKLNLKIWSLPEEAVGIEFEVLTGHKGHKKNATEVTVLCSLNFAEIEKSVDITRKLDYFDQGVYQGVSSLFEAGNTTMSLTQIYRAMGNVSRPNKANLDAIDRSLTKMGFARISINNSAEQQAKFNYPAYITCDAPLLSFVRKRVIINGKVAEGAIALIQEPPLLTFAKGRKQITRYPIKVLQAPMSKTAENEKISRYLLTRIAHAKNGSLSKTILYSAIEEEAEITTAKQRQRLPEKVEKFLSYYIDCEQIKGFRRRKDGVTLIL